MRHWRSLISMMIGLLIGAWCDLAVADTVTLNAVARGWYTSDGIANAIPGLEQERNYDVGDNASTPGVPRQINRNFFVFDLTGIGQITGATLNLFNPANGFSSG